MGAFQTRDEGPATARVAMIVDLSSQRLASVGAHLPETREIAEPDTQALLQVQNPAHDEISKAFPVEPHLDLGDQGPGFQITDPKSLLEIPDLSKINPNYLLSRVRLFYEYSSLDVGLDDRDRLSLEFLLSLGLDRAVAVTRLDDLKEFVDRQSSKGPSVEFGEAASRMLDTTQIAKPLGSKRSKPSAEPYEPREFYDQRPDKSVSASEFLTQTWGDLQKSGDLYQHRLNVTDPKLVRALMNQFAGNTPALRSLLKKKSDEVTERFERAYGPDATAEHRHKQVAAIAPAKLQR